MKNILFILIFEFICSCETSNRTNFIFNGDAKTDLKNLLPDGKFNVDIMGMSSPPPEYETITNKFRQAINSNKEWYMQYTKENYVPGKGVPYHENFGITAEEYEKLKIMSTQTKLVKDFDGEFLVKKDGDNILITASGNLPPLNNTKINLETNVVYINDIKIPYYGISDIKDTTNAIGKWKGHRWKLEEIQNTNSQSPEDVNGKILELIIGQVEKNKKTLIIFKKQIVTNGQNVESVEIPIMFDLPNK